MSASTGSRCLNRHSADWWRPCRNRTASCSCGLMMRMETNQRTLTSLAQAGIDVVALAPISDDRSWRALSVDVSYNVVIARVLELSTFFRYFRFRRWRAPRASAHIFELKVIRYFLMAMTMVVSIFTWVVSFGSYPPFLNPQDWAFFSKGVFWKFISTKFDRDEKNCS